MSEIEPIMALKERNEKEPDSEGQNLWYEGSIHLNEEENRGLVARYMGIVQNLYKTQGCHKSLGGKEELWRREAYSLYPVVKQEEITFGLSSKHVFLEVCARQSVLESLSLVMSTWHWPILNTSCEITVLSWTGTKERTLWQINHRVKGSNIRRTNMDTKQKPWT